MIFQDRDLLHSLEWVIMSDIHLLQVLRPQLEDLQARGLYKRERRIQGPQGSAIAVGNREVLNFCANNYLGLANHPRYPGRCRRGPNPLRLWHGFGPLHLRHPGLAQGTGIGHCPLSSARTTPSCIVPVGMPTAGCSRPVLGDEDVAIISDELNHASIIDGIRLCKARRFRYHNRDMGQLEQHLKEADNCRLRLIVTDGVFSMDGTLAPLPEICDLAERYDALVMVDDSHATGFMGKTGRGTPEHFGVLDRVDILTSTLGKTLGGAAGGFTCARAEVVDFLRQRSRPYLFSNSLPPPIASAALKALHLIEESGNLRQQLHKNAKQMRAGLEGAGFNVKPGEHPILPVMLGDAALATRMADQLLERGIYVVGFSYPVVPQGQARIRLQMSAAHTSDQIDRAIRAFGDIGRQLGVL